MGRFDRRFVVYSRNQSPIGVTPQLRKCVCGNGREIPFYVMQMATAKELKKELDTFHSVLVNYNTRHWVH